MTIGSNFRIGYTPRPDAEIFGLGNPNSRCVKDHGGADNALESLLIDLIAFADVDRAPGLALKAGVEEA